MHLLLGKYKKELHNWQNKAEITQQKLDEIWNQSLLGNATTAELLNELQVRARVHGYADYKTTNKKILK